MDPGKLKEIDQLYVKKLLEAAQQAEKKKGVEVEAAKTVARLAAECQILAERLLQPLEELRTDRLIAAKKKQAEQKKVQAAAVAPAAPSDEDTVDGLPMPTAQNAVDLHAKSSDEPFSLSDLALQTISDDEEMPAEGMILQFDEDKKPAMLAPAARSIAGAQGRAKPAVAPKSPAKPLKPDDTGDLTEAVNQEVVFEESDPDDGIITFGGIVAPPKAADGNGAKPGATPVSKEAKK
jgi:hypothetical protein